MSNASWLSITPSRKSLRYQESTVSSRARFTSSIKRFYTNSLKASFEEEEAEESIFSIIVIKNWKKAFEASDILSSIIFTINDLSRSRTKVFKTSFKLALQQSISSSSSISSLASFFINKTNQSKKAVMSSIKIYFFWELRDGKEDFIEYIKNLEWKYEQHYQFNDSMKSNKNRIMKVLFRQNLNDDVYQWYVEQKAEIKQNWTKLRAIFLKQYEITVKDIQAKKFELRMKMAQLK